MVNGNLTTYLFVSGNGSPSKYVMELMVNGNLTTYLFASGNGSPSKYVMELMVNGNLTTFLFFFQEMAVPVNM